MPLSWLDLVQKILSTVPPERLRETAKYREHYDEPATIPVDVVMLVDDSNDDHDGTFIMA